MLSGTVLPKFPFLGHVLCWESGGDKIHTRHEGFLMPDECWPCRRNCSGPLLISAKPPCEASGHPPLVLAPQAQISTPAEVSTSTKPCPCLDVTMALCCLSFSTWKMGAAAPATP